MLLLCSMTRDHVMKANPPANQRTLFNLLARSGGSGKEDQEDTTL